MSSTTDATAKEDEGHEVGTFPTVLMNIVITLGIASVASLVIAGGWIVVGGIAQRHRISAQAEAIVAEAGTLPVYDVIANCTRQAPTEEETFEFNRCVHDQRGPYDYVKSHWQELDVRQRTHCRIATYALSAAGNEDPRGGSWSDLETCVAHSLERRESRFP